MDKIQTTQNDRRTHRERLGARRRDDVARRGVDEDLIRGHVVRQVVLGAAETQVVEPAARGGRADLGQLLARAKDVDLGRRRPARGARGAVLGEAVEQLGEALGPEGLAEEVGAPREAARARGGVRGVGAGARLGRGELEEVGEARGAREARAGRRRRVPAREEGLGDAVDEAGLRARERPEVDGVREAHRAVAVLADEEAVEAAERRRRRLARDALGGWGRVGGWGGRLEKRELKGIKRALDHILMTMRPK